MKTAGILAGLGPLAGAYFYRRIIELTPGSNDEEHIPVVLIAEPSIPSRIRHLEGAGESPVPKLLEAIRKLVAAGADFIAIPSSTTHIFYPEKSMVPAGRSRILRPCSDSAVAKLATGAIYDSSPSRPGVREEHRRRHFQLLMAPRSGMDVYPDIAAAIDVPAISLIKAVTDGIAQTRCKTIGVLGATPMLFSSTDLLATSVIMAAKTP
ncbi:MAG: aspartate/glutamate racemase family protein [Bacilli bacterium]